MSEMYVNTEVVSALMRLKGIDCPTLAKMLHIRPYDFQAWLVNDATDEPVEVDAQFEALRFLGIHGDQPRPDVVHYWRIHEPLFSRPLRVYEPLITVLNAFGPAQASFVAAEEDPMINMKASAHFALRFPSFLAMLEVTAHPLRSIHFGPELLPNLSWMPDSFGVLLPAEQYSRLEPGAMRVPVMREYLEYSSEMRRWESLRQLARQRGVDTEKVAMLLLSYDPNKAIAAPSVNNTTSAEQDNEESNQQPSQEDKNKSNPGVQQKPQPDVAETAPKRKRKSAMDLSDLGLIVTKR